MYCLSPTPRNSSILHTPTENNGANQLDQISRFSRQLFYSLSLPPPPTIAAQELAELGGGGHETICASVQEHIADTYLGYSGTPIALPGPGGRTAENSRGRPGRGNGKETNASQADGGGGQPRRAPWTVDSEGEVRTSSAALHPPPVSGNAKEAANKKGKRRGDRQGKSGAARKTGTATGHDFDRGSNGGGSHPGSVRLGGGGDGGGDGVPFPESAGVYKNMDKNAERQREENLDKAQVWLARR